MPSPARRGSGPLYAVLNSKAPYGVYTAEPDAELRRGTVERRIAGERFDLPTTLARYGCRLYGVSSRPDDPPYPVGAVTDPACGRE